MGTLIKSTVEYTSYDTTSSALTDTLTATPGKEYEVRNSGTGGNALTITYGSDTMIFNDGESGRFTYDGSGWSTQFSTVGGAVYLTSGRKAFQELFTQDITTSGTEDLVIATTEAAAYEQISATFKVVFIGTSATDSVDIQVNCSGSAVTKTHSNTNISIVGMSNTSGVFKGAKLLSRAVSDAGFKLVLSCNFANAVDMTVQLTQVSILDAGNNSTGFSLVAPTTTNNTLTPDGNTASSLRAGDTLILTTNSTMNMNSVICFPNTTSQLRCRATWKTIPYPAASGLTITFPTGTISVVGGNSLVTLTEADISISNVSIQGYEVEFYITDTTNTPFVPGNYMFGFRIGGSGCKLTLT